MQVSDLDEPLGTPPEGPATDDEAAAALDRQRVLFWSCMRWSYLTIAATFVVVVLMGRDAPPPQVAAAFIAAVGLGLVSLRKARTWKHAVRSRATSPRPVGAVMDPQMRAMIRRRISSLMLGFPLLMVAFTSLMYALIKPREDWSVSGWLGFLVLPVVFALCFELFFVAYVFFQVRRARRPTAS